MMMAQCHKPEAPRTLLSAVICTKSFGDLQVAEQWALPLN